MTLLIVLATLAVIALFASVLVAFIQRGRDPLDLSLRGMVRAYLYVASLAAVIVFAVGLAFLIAYGLGSWLGFDFIYGGPIQTPQANDYRRFQLSQDLLRGVTFAIVGGVFWAIHWIARRAVSHGDEHASGLYRAYLVVGTAVFAITVVGFLPFGVFQALAFFLPGRPGDNYKSGAGELLSGGLAAFTLWIAFLALVLRTLRSTRAVVAG